MVAVPFRRGIFGHHTTPAASKAPSRNTGRLNPRNGQPARRAGRDASVSERTHRRTGQVVLPGSVDLWAFPGLFKIPHAAVPPDSEAL